MVKIIVKRFLLSIAVLSLTLSSGIASAMFINLNAVSNNILNPVTIFTNPTDTLYLDVVGTADGGAYDAWSAWAFNSGCDQEQPSMCAQGWLWSLGVFVNQDTGNSGGLGVPGTFADPLDALALARSTYPDGSLSITGWNSYSFFTGEVEFGADNRGGVSLRYRIVPAEVTVPLPATLALFGLGLAGLGWSRRKKA